MNKSDNANLRLGCWDDTLQQIGDFVVSFQYLDDAINACISALLSRDKRAGKIITAEMSFKAKLNILASLFILRLKTSSLPEDIREVIARIDEAEQRRNTVVHSLWLFPTSGEPSFVQRSKTRSHRRKGLHVDGEMLSPDDIHEEASQFEKIAEDLMYEFEHQLPKYYKRL